MDSVARQAAASDLAVRVHRWGRNLDLGAAWRQPLRQAARVRVLLRATAVECLAEPGRPRIAQVACRGLNGGRFAIAAKAFVLACGGYENPRLLLLSRQGRSPPGLNWGPVGRYYMNHPRCEGVGRVLLNPHRPRARQWAHRLVMHRERRVRGRLQFSFSPAEILQRREGLLNPTTFFFAVSGAGARRCRTRARGQSRDWGGNWVGGRAGGLGRALSEGHAAAAPRSGARRRRLAPAAAATLPAGRTGRR
jgi:choline dehydrogenase-like flavoprotein